MSVSPLTSYAVRPNSPLNAGASASESTVASGLGHKITPQDIHKAASQFEAIIVRQLLTPAIEPVMNGGLGGSGGGSGNGVYGYMLTDALATSMTQGKGMGLASMLEKQFTAAPGHHAVTTSAALKLQKH